MEMKHRRNPLVAAFLNFILWGTGYIYISHRRFLGGGLIVVFLLNASLLVTIPYSMLLAYSEMLFLWGMFMWFLLSILFAVDVFRETMQLRKYEDME